MDSEVYIDIDCEVDGFSEFFFLFVIIDYFFFDVYL